jgi:membrane fusion protein (multidrug efflux system)
MSGVIDAATGSVQVIALFPNPDRMLKSGGSGSIIIPKSNSSAIVIAQSCVSEVQNKKFVYTLGKDNKVKYTEIKVDPQNDGNNYIVTDGLKVGDKYVTNGITKLSDGMEIVPITPEKYQQKIDDQAKAMSAGDIVGAMKK